MNHTVTVNADIDKWGREIRIFYRTIMHLRERDDSLKIHAQALSVLLRYSRKESPGCGSRLLFIFLFLYPPHSINAALLFKARGNYKAPPPSLYHPFAIIFARELARPARHERPRDIIPRGARSSSSINASTLLTLPQIQEDERRGLLTRFSCGKGERGAISQPRSKGISRNYRRVRISEEDKSMEDVHPMGLSSESTILQTTVLTSSHTRLPVAALSVSYFSLSLPQKLSPIKVTPAREMTSWWPMRKGPGELHGLRVLARSF